MDAAQLAPHRQVNLAATGVDYLAMSGHKTYAPFGAGVLAGPADWLDEATPYLAGGGATAYVGDTFDVRWATGPARHEAGTPNLLGAVALATACATLAAADRPALEAAEQALVARLRDGLAGIPGVAELRTFGPDHDRVGIVTFAMAGIEAIDVVRLPGPRARHRRQGRPVLRPSAGPSAAGRSRRAGWPAARRLRGAGQPGTRFHRRARRPAGHRRDRAGRPQPGHRPPAHRLACCA